MVARIIIILTLMFFACATMPSMAQDAHNAQNLTDSAGTGTGNWESTFIDGQKALADQDYRKAESAFKEALRLSRGNAEDRMTTLAALVALYEETHNLAGQDDILTCMLVLMINCGEYSETTISSVYLKLADVNFMMGRLNIAEQYGTRAMQILQKSSGPMSPDMAVALNNLGWIECRMRKYSQAETYLKLANRIAEKCFGRADLLYGLTAYNLASLYESIDNRTAALTWYERASSSLNNSLGVDNPFSLEVTLQYDELRNMIRSKPPKPGRQQRARPRCKEQAEQKENAPYQAPNC